MNAVEWRQFFEQQKGVSKPKNLTSEQKDAVARYEFCLREEDRYLSSVFANALGQRAQENKTRQAFENAKRLGVSHLC